MADEESITVQHMRFLGFVLKRFIKEMFKPRVNCVKVLTASVMCAIGFHRCLQLDICFKLYAFGYYACVFVTTLETVHFVSRLPTLYRLYVCVVSDDIINEYSD